MTLPMINKLPLIGWMLSIIANVSLSVPFWFFWTVCGIGAKFFYWLPTVYLHIGFWESVGVFICAGIVKEVVTPKFANVTQTNTNNENKE